MDLNTILKSIKIKNSDTCSWQYPDNPTTEKEYKSSIIFYDSNGDIIEIPTNYSWSKIQSEKTSLEQEKTTQENNKASAKQKLQDLGLTIEEIKDTFGL
tara:strand:+ start:464 stop:760 length:297 start_codon:yes stop_codon:yes gene_type:complete